MNRYWDSDCFLGWFLGEPDKLPYCQGVIQAAEAKKLKIVTSALTLTEVIKLKNHPSLRAEDEARIKAFFRNDFISLRNVDRFVAEYARELIWTYSHLNPKDSIHLATAIMIEADALNTFDDHLLRLDGQIGNPVMRITKPDLPYEPVLEAADGTTIIEQTDEEE